MANAKVGLVFIALNLAFLLCPEAFGNNEDATTKQTATSKPPKNNFYLEFDGYKCRDAYGRCSQEKCVKYGRRRMRRICKKTCGYCRALSPPACFSSPYGCCWDYLTSALGPGGRGCPPCNDNKRYPYVCRRFKTYCRRKGISGKWMRINCPDGCGHCDLWQF